jgi:hypothetical protein
MTSLLALSLVMAAPQRLSNFGALMDKLKGGYEVRVVVDYAKTKLVIDGKEEEAPKAIGGSKIDHWEWFDRGVVRNKLAYVAASSTVLIGHPSYGYVENYVRFRIYEDQSVEITARYLKGVEKEIVMDEIFKGKISNGKDEHGVSFFTEP